VDTECAPKIYVFNLGQKIKMLMFTFKLLCMLLEGYDTNFTLTVLLGDFKNIEIFGFLVYTQPA
jgi:hypothetical protein